VRPASVTSVGDGVCKRNWTTSANKACIGIGQEYIADADIFFQFSKAADADHIVSIGADVSMDPYHETSDYFANQIKLYFEIKITIIRIIQLLLDLLRYSISPTFSAYNGVELL